MMVSSLEGGAGGVVGVDRSPLTHQFSDIRHSSSRPQNDWRALAVNGNAVLRMRGSGQWRRNRYKKGMKQPGPQRVHRNCLMLFMENTKKTHFNVACELSPRSVFHI